MVWIQRSYSHRRDAKHDNFSSVDVDAEIKMTAFAPRLFKYIRMSDDYDDKDIIESLDPKANRH